MFENTKKNSDYCRDFTFCIELMEQCFFYSYFRKRRDWWPSRRDTTTWQEGRAFPSPPPPWERWEKNRSVWEVKQSVQSCSLLWPWGTSRALMTHSWFSPCFYPVVLYWYVGYHTHTHTVWCRTVLMNADENFTLKILVRVLVRVTSCRSPYALYI